MSELDLAITEVMREHPQKVDQIRQRPSQVGWLVGKVMLKGSFGSYEYIEKRLKRTLGI